MNRRHFLRQVTLVSTTASLAPTLPAWALAPNNPYRANIGLQLYTLRDPLSEDVEGTIKAVAEAGYKQVETYRLPDSEDGKWVFDAAEANGLVVNSSHFAWESVTDPERDGAIPFDQILQTAKDAGLSHLVIPYLRDYERKTLDDYRRVADRCNTAATKAKEAGIQLAYHNHAFEFEPKQAEGGGTGFEVLIERFAPEMQFEVDVFWVKVGDVEPVELIRRLKGRVSQLHLKDLKAGIELPHFAKLPKEAFKELGNGIIPMEPIIEAAGEAGVAHCHVEQDQSPDPIASVSESIAYLGGL